MFWMFWMFWIISVDAFEVLIKQTWSFSCLESNSLAPRHFTFWVFPVRLTAGWRVSAAGTPSDPVQGPVLSAGSSLVPNCCLHTQKHTSNMLIISTSETQRGLFLWPLMDRWAGLPVSVCVLKGVSAARLGAELPSRSGRDEETAGSDGFLLHFSTSGNSSWCRDQERRQSFIYLLIIKLN